jgi:hypothetical protein
MVFCKYSNLLGVPNEGAHKARVLGFARNDILLTIVLAIIICLIFKTNFLITLLITFVIGELLHLLFCVNTRFINMLGITFKKE